MACGFLLIGYVAVAGMGYLLPAVCSGWALHAHEAVAALLLACILSTYTATVFRSPGGVLCGWQSTATTQLWPQCPAVQTKGTWGLTCVCDIKPAVT